MSNLTLEQLAAKEVLDNVQKVSNVLDITPDFLELLSDDLCAIFDLTEESADQVTLDEKIRNITMSRNEKLQKLKTQLSKASRNLEQAKEWLTALTGEAS